MFSFDKIYLINLATRPDRLYNSTAEAEKYGFERQMEVLPAVAAKDFKAQYGLVNNAANGCSVSHLLAYQRAKFLGLNNYLVLEDDFEINPDIAKYLPSVMAELPKDWDLLYFGASVQEPCENVSEHLLKITKSFCTHAFAVNMHGRFGDILSKFDFSTSIDAFISYYQKELNCYLSNPPLVWQRADHSDIENRFMNYEWLKQPL